MGECGGEYFMKISVVIPAYNEALNIKNTIDNVINVLNNLDIKDYEIIIIDDHSSDGTFELIKSLNYPNIVCYRLSRNLGSHIALRAGLFHSKGDTVLCMAADGQDDPNCLGEMLEKWEKGAKVIWALRQNRDNETFMIKSTAKIFYILLSWLVDEEYNKIDLYHADFPLLDRVVVDAINQCRERNSSLFGLIVWLGFSQDTVEYNRRKRAIGHSKWTFNSRIRLAKDWIVAFSGIPLRISSYLGTIFAMSGFVYSMYVWVGTFFGTIPSTGWSSLIIAILVLGGIQMIMIGIIGDYLWQNLDETRQRPLFFIESTTEESKKDKDRRS